MFEINGIVYAGEFKDTISITDAKITGELTMLLTFSSGEKRVFDASALTGPVFEPLKNHSVFENFKIEYGVITWNDGTIDCAPEFMYEHSYAYEEIFI